VHAPWWWSERLWLAGGDGWWGTTARARGGGEGPVSSGRGVGGGSPRAVHSGGTKAKGDATGGLVRRALALRVGSGAIVRRQRSSRWHR
jgi:hypothetical protein